MAEQPVMLITGTSRGIGRHLAEYYAARNYKVVGTSRGKSDFTSDKYAHFSLDVSDESAVKDLFREMRTGFRRLDVLINNAGAASMNHSLLTPLDTVHRIMATNFMGTYLFCREAAKLMKRGRFGRIVNFGTVAVPLKVQGESIYASSKAAVVTLTQILAKEFAQMGITVNAVGPTPIQTDLIKGVAEEKLDRLLGMQAIPRFGEFRDITNVIDFFIRKESDFVTGQVIYLGGV